MRRWVRHVYQAQHNAEAVSPTVDMYVSILELLTKLCNSSTFWEPLSRFLSELLLLSSAKFPPPHTHTMSHWHLAMQIASVLLDPAALHYPRHNIKSYLLLSIIKCELMSENVSCEENDILVTE